MVSRCDYCEKSMWRKRRHSSPFDLDACPYELDPLRIRPEPEDCSYFRFDIRCEYDDIRDGVDIKQDEIEALLGESLIEHIVENLARAFCDIWKKLVKVLAR